MHTCHWDQGEMFHPAAAAACGVLLNQGWVGSPEIMVTSHMGFDLRASPPLPLLGSPRFAGGGVAASHPRGNLLPCPTKHGDGNHPAQLGASSSSNVWPWPEEDALNEKELLAGNKKKRKKKNSTVFNENMVSNLSIGATRKKKLKVRKKLREPRFCFQTQSDVDVLDDGYKWRKYGQKVVKDTQHPRSYYRCTQRDCRVKKRIERLAEDPRMVITTYEGRHAHSPSPHEESSQASSKLNLFWQ
ncbi:WRKY DNA -binding domain [Musa troglodytarum]|uniref:WRKY DNA -binding domain n=1 Tax=Musa troglodytarum TaxID=320322 RepID=A0A9E7I7B6_9LILI|nr:WRKY DNA -binding domain [Musa troglodytarum]